MAPGSAAVIDEISILSLYFFLGIRRVGGLQAWHIPDAVVNQHAVAERQGLPVGDIHRLVEQERGVEIVAGAGTAIPWRWVARIARVIEHGDATRQFEAA